MTPRTAIGLIAFAELCGTSLWFSANGVAAALAAHWSADAVVIGHLTSAVQLGFVCGTLALAFSGLADRYTAPRLFLAASLLGALANAAFALPGATFPVALASRFVTGVALAGIYPLGMKLVVSFAPQRAGRALGWLVGMLVLGTSLPHLLEALSWHADWRATVLTASALALVGGVIVSAVGNGPHAPPAAPFNVGGVLRAFRDPRFRAAAGGYFGHMWELYTLWTLAPYLLVTLYPDAQARAVSFGAFVFIALGAAGCMAGGVLTSRFGSARVAATALAGSGALCLLWPLLESVVPPPVLLVLLAAWGVAVVSDSPQFSALIARHAPAEAVGSAFAVVNGAGFLISVLSISLLMPLWQRAGMEMLWLLAPGPLAGLLLLRPALREPPAMDSAPSRG